LGDARIAQSPYKPIPHHPQKGFRGGGCGSFFLFKIMKQRKEIGAWICNNACANKNIIGN
jgi:hypothetical protein